MFESCNERARYKYKLADKRAALEALGRHYGLFADKGEHSMMVSWEAAVEAVAEARQRRAREAELPAPHQVIDAVAEPAE
jgi:hypothetical protein